MTVPKYLSLLLTLSKIHFGFLICSFQFLIFEEFHLHLEFTQTLNLSFPNDLLLQVILVLLLLKRKFLSFQNSNQCRCLRVNLSAKEKHSAS